MAKKGFLILTDISGYTEFLTKSELDHAQDALQSLFDVQVANIHHPFVISGFRGDAIFMYVPEKNICTAQTLLESLENLYFVFADTLRQMIFNTTCTCRACKNMSKLDLKMVIHYREYAIQKLGDREELLGADVIVPHRMLKNHVIEKTGIESYALFSEAAADALNLSGLAYPLASYAEAYEHLGEVKMRVLDLRKVWETEQDRKRTTVTPEEAWIIVDWDIRYPPVLVWDNLTNLALEQIFLEYDLVERTDSLGGRFQQESSYHCAHGETHFFNTILDWKPFEYLTLRQKISNGVDIIQTRKIVPTETGSRLTFLIRNLQTDSTDETRQMPAHLFREAGEKFMKFMDSGIANGLITLAQNPDFDK